MITKEPPTEPGDYWWRGAPSFGWRIVSIYRADDGLRVKDGEFSLRFLVKSIRKDYPNCEWCRIPDPDEVCEWTNHGYGWESSCGHEMVIDVDFCPFCGLPVKEKEGQGG